MSASLEEPRLVSFSALEEAGPGRALLELGRSFAFRAEGFLEPELCRALSLAVYRARELWTSAFGGEQHSLGRAYYTHLEEGLADEYFEHARASDALVEATLPGMQARVLEAVALLTGGRAARRAGYCGPGVHVFPNGEHVARRGGVVHFDTEGLPEEHSLPRRPALSLVAMLQPPQRGGGLRLWDVLYSGADAPTERELAAPSATFEYGVGELCVFDSYRLHQIQPFGGRRDRISVTAHAAETEPGSWEVWF